MKLKPAVRKRLYDHLRKVDPTWVDQNNPLHAIAEKWIDEFQTEASGLEVKGRFVLRDLLTYLRQRFDDLAESTNRLRTGLLNYSLSQAAGIIMCDDYDNRGEPGDDE
jgi:hypothetical protein